MRQPSPFSRPRFAPRSLSLAAMAAATLLASGCSWFHHKDEVYAQSPESRPLEVPPDLDRPNTEGAMALPDAPRSVTRSSMTAASAGNNGFSVAGSRDEVFEKVGDALAAMQGVTIASKAQLLGAYDVNYQGSNFLVRVSDASAGVYVSAVDPRGVPATGDAARQLIAALKGALGG